MIKNIKIGSEVFEYHDLSCQLSIDGHSTLFLSFDIYKHEHYKQYFLSLYDDHTHFNILSSGFISKRNIIKSIDIDPKNKLLTLIIKSDAIDIIPAEQRRDDTINELLNTTFKSNNSINN
jgi:hypothetical protein